MTLLKRKGLWVGAIFFVMAAVGTVHAADSIGMLYKLIETAKDGEKGYRASAEAVKNPGLKALFNSYADQRAKFAVELQDKVRMMGGDPTKPSETAAAVIYDGWVNLKSALTRGDEKAILSEVERGESVAVKVFEDAAMSNELPDDVRSLVKKQAKEVRQTYEKVKNLENKEAMENKMESLEAKKDTIERKEEALKNKY